MCQHFCINSSTDWWCLRCCQTIPARLCFPWIKFRYACSPSRTRMGWPAVRSTVQYKVEQNDVIERYFYQIHEVSVPKFPHFTLVYTISYYRSISIFKYNIKLYPTYSFRERVLFRLYLTRNFGTFCIQFMDEGGGVLIPCTCSSVQKERWKTPIISSSDNSFLSTP